MLPFSHIDQIPIRYYCLDLDTILSTKDIVVGRFQFNIIMGIGKRRDDAYINK